MVKNKEKAAEVPKRVFKTSSEAVARRRAIEQHQEEILERKKAPY